MFLIHKAYLLALFEFCHLIHELGQYSLVIGPIFVQKMSIIFTFNFQDFLVLTEIDKNYSI